MTALLVSEQLEALTDPDLDEADQVKRWQHNKSVAPGVLKAATSPIVISLLTAEAKKQLGLPPG